MTGCLDRDAFSKREQGEEAYYVRQREMEKLKALKEKIAEHQKHLDELDKNVYVLSPPPEAIRDQRSRYTDRAFVIGQSS